MPTFDKYIAIDWSGAKTEWDSKNKCSRIEVAECDNSGNVSLLAKPNNGNKQYWKRNEIYNKLCDIINTKEKVLIGIDFAFAFPYCFKKSYFPEMEASPRDRKKLWTQIKNICNNNYYFFDNNNNDYIHYLHTPKNIIGNKYQDRFRLTESYCAYEYSVPNSVYKCFGYGQVGSGSLAGMGMLNDLQSEIPIWPFNKCINGSCIVEIYPKIFHVCANSDIKDYGDANKVNCAVSHYECIYKNSLNSKHEFDALISALALRYYATCTKNDYFDPQNMTDCARQYEGWIFGVL